MGFSEMLENELGSNISEKGLHYIDVVIKSSKKMSKLIDDLLHFSRTGRTEFKRVKIDMNQLTEKARTELQHEIKERNIDWNLPELPDAYGDRPLLLQVFINLVSNAVKYSGKKDPAVIEIGSMPGEDDSTVYYVKDNGVGFNMKYVDQLFGVFNRLHTDDEFIGTGIGLALVKRIIERHGGKVWAEGEIDKGAVIYLELPISM